MIAACFVAAPAAAWAQRSPSRQPEAAAEPSYAFEYGLVIFVIMLGLAVVFRPSRRIDPVDEIQLPFVTRH